MIETIVFILGLIIGSFLNVVIYRMPLDQSVIFPASHCPICQHKLAWFELIPLVSYLVQRGKCRHCQTSVSIQYPLVEVLTGVAYVLLLTRYGLTPELFVVVVFISLLIPIVFIDFRHQIIPDTLNLAGAILGLLLLPFAEITLFNAVTGALIGGAVMLLIAVITRGGMGGGDIKMVAMMGVFLGLKLTILSLFVSFIIAGFGSALLILTGIKKRKDFIPFGPFLALGGISAYVFGQEIIAWYWVIFS